MMITTSTAPAFKAALLAAMQGDANLLSVQVLNTYPGSLLRDTATYFGTTKADVTTPVIASASRIKRHEAYTMELHIDVANGVSDESSAEDVAFGILGEVDTLLANNATMSQSVIVAYVKTWNNRPYFDDARQGWAVLLTAEIYVQARLS
jgi:hypothetical protein